MCRPTGEACLAFLIINTSLCIAACHARYLHRHASVMNPKLVIAQGALAFKDETTCRPFELSQCAQASSTLAQVSPALHRPKRGIVIMNFKLLSVLTVGLLSAAPAFSAPVTLDFEGVHNFGSVNDFYNGGFDIPANLAGTTPASGVNYGIHFGGDVLGVTNAGLGPNEQAFTNLPTASATVISVVGPDAAMNVASGFAGTVSFYYSSTAAADIMVYDGLNGTGNVLATYSLLNNAQSNGCTDSAFCNWSLASFNFSGVAQSIQFASAAGVAGFDNVSVSAVPLPAAAWLLLSGLGGLGVFGRKRNV